MKLKLLAAVMTSIIVFTGCIQQNAHQSVPFDNQDKKVINNPIEDTEFNAEELFYINVARQLFIVHVDIEGCCTELDKAEVFSWIISTDIYKDEVENWQDKNSGKYKISLDNVEDIVFTRLDTNTFNPELAFRLFNKTYYGYDSCNKGISGYYAEKEVYIPPMIGGYGGAAALGVLEFKEVDNTIKVVLGSYDMNKFYSDTPEYVLLSKYTVTFFNNTNNVENYKILSAQNDFMDDKVHQIITPEGDRIPLRIFDYNYISNLRSLINCDDWSDATQIDGYMLINYYRDFLETKDKLEEKYFMKDGNGLLFPQEEFESFIGKHLDISADYMRKHYEEYDEAKEGYQFEGGGIGIDYMSRIANVEQDGNIVKVLLDVFYYDGETKVEVRQKELTIKLKPNLEFLFISFKSV